MATNKSVRNVPEAHIASNNNRIKRYKTDSQPTYYLKKGQEFQIELFNPTRDIIKCDISLNGSILQGGGLVLKPGQRVFLDRYLNSPKKFLFDTYEVGKSQAVKEAIVDNGSVSVEFYREKPKPQLLNDSSPHWTYYNNTGSPVYRGEWTTSSGKGLFGTTSVNTNVSSTNTSNTTVNYSSGPAEPISSNSNDWYGMQPEMDMGPDEPQPIRSRGFSKKIETGRIEEGSKSDQTFEYVDYDFEMFTCHTVHYKLLPISQKQTTVGDLNVKRYCVMCGSKQKPNFKFCPNCGQKV